MKRVVLAVMMLAVSFGLLTACSNNNTVATIGDAKVPVGQATFVLRELEAMYEQQYGPDVWLQGAEGTTFDQLAKDGALESMTRLYISNDVADESGIVLTDEEVAGVETHIKEYLETKSEEALKEDGISLEDMRAVFMMNAIGEKLMDAELVGFELDQAELEAALNNDHTYQQIETLGYEGVLEQVTVQEVLIPTVKEDGTKFNEEEMAQAKKTAQEVYDKANEGEAFDSLVEEYSKDPGRSENKGIHTFYRGEMADDGDFEAKSFAMAIGDIEIVESEFGYYIIRKMDHLFPDEEEVQSVVDYESFLVEQYTLTQRREEYDKIYAEWKPNYEIRVNDNVWDQVKTTYALNNEKENKSEPAGE